MNITQILCSVAIAVGCAIIGLIIPCIKMIASHTKEVRKAVEAEAKPLEEAIESLRQDLSETQKAIILGQSKDAESKKALIELLWSRKEELKPVAEAVKEEIAHEEDAKKVVLEKVSGDYTPVD